MKAIVGPVGCQGCQTPVYWGRRTYKGEVIGDLRWREVTDEMPHVCLVNLPQYALEQRMPTTVAEKVE